MTKEHCNPNREIVRFVELMLLCVVNLRVDTSRLFGSCHEKKL